MRRETAALIRVLSELVSTGLVAAALYVAVDLLAAGLPRVPAYVFNVAKAAIIIGAGVAGTRALGNYIIRVLEPRVKDRAYAVGNTFKLLGYIGAVAAGLLRIGATAEVALLGGTVTGLVLGLALQPILSNLFAGLLIIATNFIKVGDDVRVLNINVPFQWAFSPGYKFFSPDYISPGFKGKVVEVNLFYTIIVLDNGQELKVPNSIMLGGAVVDSSPEWTRHHVINVRVELPLSVVDVEGIEDKIRELLSDLGVKAVYLNEQSDKDYVIILARLSVPRDRDWRAVKSQALKRLLKLREELIKANEAKYLCLTRGICR
ncbi:MAG: mechanosensitive ion channel family protein [Thermoproteus sp.]|nr:mechanosensitive ion channel family protein [Thermoproteus sp.]